MAYSFMQVHKLCGAGLQGVGLPEYRWLPLAALMLSRADLLCLVGKAQDGGGVG